MWNGSSLAALDIPLGHRYAESHIAKLSARSAPAHLRSPRLLIGGIAGAMLSRRPRATQWTSELSRQVSQGCCDEASGSGPRLCNWLSHYERFWNDRLHRLKQQLAQDRTMTDTIRREIAFPAVEVSPLVNSAKNNGPELLQPAVANHTETMPQRDLFAD